MYPSCSISFSASSNRPRHSRLLFEAKQTINAPNVDYAQKKVASVRRLHRTSLPIPHTGGTYAPKTPAYILGGILTFEAAGVHRSGIAASPPSVTIRPTGST